MKHINKSMIRAFAVLAALALLSSPALAATVTLNADATQLKGRPFDLNVSVDAIGAAYGIAFDLVYDPEYLEVVDLENGLPVQPSTTEGTLFNNAGADPTILRAALQEDVPGTLVLGLTRSGDIGAVSAVSETDIISVSFIPKKVGTTSVTFQAQAIMDASDNPATVDLWSPITMDIEILKGDVDGSFVVDMADAIQVLKIMIGIANDANLDSDVDGAGKISLEEAIYILQTVSEQ
ncbi:cohesin domain-containing protein [Desulfatibacillum aliphaticivorans]|uniref:Cohesin domain-containing protein n=1 Tax=Desulfatibacillum aliphaticivorans TaxID=218208 RepID=B8FII7_DESAL|nr:cohesin domain-containing protein [Desulfatibacillum aliphaticivorans]ACL03977.1 hypothetical protein Dalk_2284 [Desulfatibacillum aliphaticivorans]